MITVVFKKNKGKLVSYRIEGHADFSESGTDIVCSAVSALAYAFANGVTEVLKVNADISVSEGFLNLDLEVLSEADKEKCQILMETMLLGIQSMEINYREYIKVKIEEV